jgi:hypothetical protein
MAVYARPEDAAQSRQAAVLHLSEQLVQCAMDVGRVTESLASIQNELDQEPIPQQAYQTVPEMALRIDNLVIRVLGFQKEIDSEDLASIDRVMRAALEGQVQALARQVAHLKEEHRYSMHVVAFQADCTYDELRPLFDRQVSQYLHARNGADLITARKTEEELRKKKNLSVDLSETLDRWAGHEVHTVCQSTSLGRHMDHLSNQIGLGGSGNSCGRLLYKLEEAIAGGLTVESLMNREEIDALINELHQELGSDRVNRWVWELASRPKVKNYGVEHRYDDLSRLRESIRNAGQELVKKILKEGAKELDQETVFVELYELIGLPMLEDPRKWIHENACYYIADLKRAIEKVKLARHDIVEIKRGSFRSSQQLDVSLFDPQFSRGFGPAESPFTQILKRLVELIEQKAPISEEFKAEVEKMIGELSKRGQEEAINDRVYQLSSAPYKTSGRWAVKHRYDDLEVLRQALQTALEKDVHENIVVQRFTDEEDRNAFYVEIARLGLVGSHGSTPSDIAPVAYGRQNIAMYLHRIEEAVQNVQQEIKYRQAKIHPRSFAGLSGSVSIVS